METPKVFFILGGGALAAGRIREKAINSMIYRCFQSLNEPQEFGNWPEIGNPAEAGFP
jgi:hypothetical protein